LIFTWRLGIQPDGGKTRLALSVALENVIEVIGLMRFAIKTVYHDEAKPGVGSHCAGEERKKEKTFD
jgi:hypothetical protein